MDYIHLDLVRGQLAERAAQARHSGHLIAAQEARQSEHARRAQRPGWLRQAFSKGVPA